MLYAFLTLFLLTANAESQIPLPKEIILTLQEEFPSASPIKPMPEDMEITIKGEKSSQTIRVGVTKDTIDLAAFIDKNQTSVEFFFKPSFEITDKTKLFFMNRYRPSISKDTPGGMACGKAVLVHKQLDKLFSTQGIKLMTKDGGYLNLLGGDFLLTHLENQQMRVVYFKIIDGRYASRMCK